jgi:hypothetical protein
MTTKAPRKYWHLDSDGRVSPQANDQDWQVVAADKDRIDPGARYLFCAPSFLFPVNSTARALNLEIIPTASSTGNSIFGKRRR